MRHTKISVVIAGVLACALFHSGLAHAGDVYKYVDDHGTTLYTDKPIPGAVLVSTGSQRPPEVAQRNYAATQAATNSQLSASNQRIAESKDNSRLAANVAKDLEASRAERCKKARENYNFTITSLRLATSARSSARITRGRGRVAGAEREIASVVGPLCTPLDLLADSSSFC